MINSCYLIGEDSLILQCATQLLARNYKIVLIISPIKSIQQWAKNHHITWLKSVDDLKITETSVVDYIFSIVNSQILSASFIKIARIAVINYHDSLLPDYAGLNATTWAILNGETNHGVTWHLINERIDEGDIIIQRSFPIEKVDTALTLNLRCYEQAISSFSELLDYLTNKRSLINPQQLQHRRYFSATHLLPDLGFINWQSMSANNIIRMHKALFLGHYKNNVGRLKIYLHDDFLIITDVYLIESNQSIQKKPGTILKVNREELHVTTCCNRAISLRFFAVSHQANSPFNTHYNLISGAQLPILPNNLIELHSESYRIALKQERFWVKELQEISEHNTFSAQKINVSEFYKVKQPLEWDTFFQSKADTNHSIMLLSAVMIYFFRLNNCAKTSIFLVPENLSVSQQQLPRLFPCFMPLSLSSVKATYSLAKTAQIIEEKYQDILSHKGYLGDIYSRQPVLEDSVSSSIIVSFSSLELDMLPANTIIYIHIDKKTRLLSCYHRFNKNYRDGALLQLINCFNNHINNIINQLLTQPQTPVNKFCFLNGAERQSVLQLGRGKSYLLPSDSLTTLFEKNVKRYPGNPAILINKQVISYLQLWQMAETIAVALCKSVAPKTFIGIYTIRNPVMLAIILGILKADCIYVPLDPKYPLGKIDLIIKEAKLSLIATTSNYSKKLKQYFKKSTISLLDAEALLNQSLQKQAFSVSLQRSQDELAYVMFTSGTTGVPKGVMITHKNVINYCYWFNQTTHFTHQSIIDFSSSIAFDLSIPCTIAPLLAGGAIAICSEEEKINPLMYLKHLQKYKVTHTELTPGYLELLLNYPDEIRQLNTILKYLMLGADVLRASEVNQWLALCPSTQIVNEYGPTEATVSVTSYFVQPQNFLHKSAVPIGRLAYNNYGYVVDKYHNLCPMGMKGELCVGGAQIALGYLGKPELTSEKFITMSFGKQGQMRLYKTGDEVCWLPDKQLQFFGRKDSQVKIHGYRIELPEIETVLMQHPGVHQAIVVLKKQAQEKYLCAYLIESKSTLTLKELKDFLANQLPFYMIPKEFYLVDTIPLKENEKIDFIRLERQPQKRLFFAQMNTSNTMTLTQQYCLDIWQTVFNRSIQLEDNFFDLGGDSLMALQIITTLKTYYSLPISLSCLFENPTIALLANKVDHLLANNSKKKTVQNLSNVLIKLCTGVYPVPIFLVHPVGGSIFWYQQLAQWLQGKYTIYGIQDPSIEGSEKRFKSLEEMANFYLRKIDDVYRGESYCLGGASFGATVAFEMAYQLQQAGLSIEFLGLMDGWAHYPAVLMKENTLNLLSYSNQQLPKERYLQLVELEEYRKKLLLNYSIPVLNNDVILFKAHELWEDFANCNDPFNGWRPYIRGNIIVETIPGTHESIFFNPNVKVLAEIFGSSANL